MNLLTTTNFIITFIENISSGKRENSLIGKYFCEMKFKLFCLPGFLLNSLTKQLVFMLNLCVR